METRSRFTLIKPAVLTGILCLAPHTSGVAAGLSGAAAPALDCVVQPSEIIDLGAPVAGLIEQIHYDRSDIVGKGDALVQLDASVERADVALSSRQAETDTAIKLRKAALSLGYKTKKRNDRLQNESMISAQDIDKLDTDIKIAELNLLLEEEKKSLARLSHQRAITLLERKTVRSPIDGVVVERYKSMGEYVNDDPILRVAQIDPLHVEVVVPIDYGLSLSTGMKANVHLDTEGEQLHVAVVERIDRVMDAASGTFGVRLSLDNPGYGIPAGILCQLNFIGAGS